MVRLRPGTDRGSGALSAVFGVTMFLAFLMLTTHILVNLWVRSTVDHIAWETARRAAADPRYATAPRAVQSEQLSWARDRLGAHAGAVTLRFESDPSGRSVVLAVDAEPATIVGSAVNLGGLHQRVVVQREG